MGASWLAAHWFPPAGIGATGRSTNLNWVSQLYGLQGIAGLSTDHQLKALADFGIRPGQARAIGVSAIANWLALPKLQFTARAAGQAAFNGLPFDMGFSLGSDSGLKGLPGQLVSGDSGYLGSLEAAYTLWKGQSNQLQLVPFLVLEKSAVSDGVWNLKTLLALAVSWPAGCREKPGIWSWVGCRPLIPESGGLG